MVRASVTVRVRIRVIVSSRHKAMFRFGVRFSVWVGVMFSLGLGLRFGLRLVSGLFIKCGLLIG
jgi:hypothetical protein